MNIDKPKWAQLLDSGTDLLLRGGDTIMDNTLGRLKAPLADEEKARIYVETTTNVLSHTTGADLGDQEKLAKLAAIEDQLAQYGELNRQQRNSVGKQLLKDMSNPDTFVAEEEKKEVEERPAWQWVLFLIVNLFMLLFNRGLYTNKEVENYINQSKEKK